MDVPTLLTDNHPQPIMPISNIDPLPSLPSTLHRELGSLPNSTTTTQPSSTCSSSSTPRIQQSQLPLINMYSTSPSSQPNHPNTTTITASTTIFTPPHTNYPNIPTSQQTPKYSSPSHFSPSDRDTRLEKAVALVNENKYSVRKAANALSLPKSTVHRYLQATRGATFGVSKRPRKSNPTYSNSHESKLDKCGIAFLIDNNTNLPRPIQKKIPNKYTHINTSHTNNLPQTHQHQFASYAYPLPTHSPQVCNVSYSAYQLPHVTQDQLHYPISTPVVTASDVLPQKIAFDDRFHVRHP